MKVSEMFEGENSTLRKTFDDIADFDLPEVEIKKSTKVRLHVSESACVDCE